MRRYVDQEGIAWAVISRAEKRNAWSSEVSRLLIDFISKISGDRSVLGLVITGDGDYFSAGIDLREILGAGDRDKIYEIFDLARRAFESIALFEKPVVVAVNGPAYGISVELTHLADYVIASKKASFAITGARLGLVPPISPIIGWINIGARRASYLTISGFTITPENALRIGLVDEITDPDGLSDRARAIIKEISKSDPEAVSIIKRAIARQRLRDIEEGFKLIAESALRDSTRKRIEDFLSKR